MYLQLNHKKLEVYKVTSSLVTECYRITNLLPADERFNLVQQIRRAALSVCLNISEGSSRKSNLERKRFFEIARGSVVELDTALEVSVNLQYFKEDQIQLATDLMIQSFKMLSKLTTK